MRIKYWSSDVCSSDLRGREGRDMERGDGRAAAIAHRHRKRAKAKLEFFLDEAPALLGDAGEFGAERRLVDERALGTPIQCGGGEPCRTPGLVRRGEQHPRSEEHTSELQSLMRISYAVFCLNKNKN